MIIKIQEKLPLFQRVIDEAVQAGEMTVAKGEQLMKEFKRAIPDFGRPLIIKDRMDKAVLALKDEFGSLRTGRASASLLDQVMVEAYGSTTPLNAVASVSVPP